MKKRKKKNRRSSQLKRSRKTTNSPSSQSSSQSQSEQEVPGEAKEFLDESIEEILFSPGAQIMGFGLYEGIESKITKKE